MVFLSLDAEEYDRKYSDKDLISRIGVYFNKNRKSMAIVIIFITLSSLFYGLVPFFLSRLLETLEYNRDVLYLIILIMVILLLNSLLIPP